ncbi:MAG: ABC transporter permease [Elusimicrobia bacterium]|nr:ABC transporter permease [Elusimicrobiota bacterium]
MRELFNAARTGITEIWAHKTRSALSFLAIAAGSVVFIDASSAIVNTYSSLRSQREVSGIARMKVSANSAMSFSDPDAGYRESPKITYDDVLELSRRIPGLYMVSPEERVYWNVVSYGGRRYIASTYGVTPDWTKRDFTYKLRGRFINKYDMEHKQRVCVLIRKAPPPPRNDLQKTWEKGWGNITGPFDNLLSHGDMLGKTVNMGGLTFTVVGVLDQLPYSERPDTILGYNRDSQVLAPLTTLDSYSSSFRTADTLDVNIDTGDEATFGETMRKIRNFFKIRFGSEDAFLLEDQMGMIRETIAKRIKNALVTISLGMLAFLAGGIGIMNVTLATVFARTREIGIRRAIGASRRDIMLQFMVEAVMLGTIGGVLGSALGWLWDGPIKVILGMGGSHIEAWIPLASVLIAAFTAFAFAIYPAWVAASLNPADALRAE